MTLMHIYRTNKVELVTSDPLFALNNTLLPPIMIPTVITNMWQYMNRKCITVKVTIPIFLLGRINNLFKIKKCINHIILSSHLKNQSVFDIPSSYHTLMYCWSQWCHIKFQYITMVYILLSQLTICKHG